MTIGVHICDNCDNKKVEGERVSIFMTKCELAAIRLENDNLSFKYLSQLWQEQIHDTNY